MFDLLCNVLKAIRRIKLIRVQFIVTVGSPRTAQKTNQNSAFHLGPVCAIIRAHDLVAANLCRLVKNLNQFS